MPNSLDTEPGMLTKAEVKNIIKSGAGEFFPNRNYLRVGDIKENERGYISNPVEVFVRRKDGNYYSFWEDKI